jgi:hypothetical protein
VSWIGEKGLRWTCLVSGFATGRARKGWRSSDDMKREGDTASYLIDLLSERFGIRWDRYQIGKCLKDF